MNLVVFIVGAFAIVYVGFILLTGREPEPWIDPDAPAQLCDHWPVPVTVRRHDVLVCRDCAKGLDRMNDRGSWA